MDKKEKKQSLVISSNGLQHEWNIDVEWITL